jgi:hypothetical protein
MAINWPYACFRAKTPPAIHVVTNLDAKGPGSLRWAADQKGPALIAFNVSGTIKATPGEFIFQNPFVTVAGQTAPSPGITIRDATISIKDSDIDLAHLKIRVGDEHKRTNHENTDCLDIATSRAATDRILIQNCSLSWAIDEIAHITGAYSKKVATDCTYYRCFFTEALSQSMHPKGEHSKALLIGPAPAVKDLYIKECLFMGCRDRIPTLNPGFGSAAIINNLYHGNGRSIEIAGPPSPAGTYLVIANNYFTDIATCLGMGIEKPLENCKLYISGNLSTDNSAHLKGLNTVAQTHLVSEWPIKDVKRRWFHPDILTRGGDNAAYDPRSGFPVYPAYSVPHRVLNFAGARPADRDPIDRTIVGAVVARTYTGNPDTFVGYGTFGSDHSGMYLDKVSESRNGWDMRAGSHKLILPENNTDAIRAWLAEWSAKAEFKGYA